MNFYCVLCLKNFVVHVHKFLLHRNNRAVCLVLIQHGADVHLQDTDGDTPLMLAEGTDLKQAMMSEEKSWRGGAVCIALE